MVTKQKFELVNCATSIVTQKIKVCACQSAAPVSLRLTLNFQASVLGAKSAQFFGTLTGITVIKGW